MKNIQELEAQVMGILSQKASFTIHDITIALGLQNASSAEKRALQRGLRKLVTQGVLMAEGLTKARQYRRAQSISLFNNIPISPQAQVILTYLSQPLSERKNVGYQREFLESYKPNQTQYLDTKTLTTLFELGRVQQSPMPVAGTYARHILNRLLIDLSWNSSRLEGNTYSILETQNLIEHGISATGKDPVETQMVLNHKNAIEYIVESSDEPMISSLEICSIHALLSENLLGDPRACGRIRHISVGISGTAYHPLDDPHQLQEYFDRFIEKINLIKNPFEQSIFAIVHLSYLQAFEDVNKRTARLVANIPLIKHNLKPLSFIEADQEVYIAALLGVYEKNDVSLLKDFYLWAYQQSAQHYTATQQAFGEPNWFRMQYRSAIHKIVRDIILDKIPRPQLIETIKSKIQALNLQESEAKRLFVEIETEIIGLHEANVARYKIRPSEFLEWKKLSDEESGVTH